MKLIIGLGNIGQNYAETRHNLGFKVVDKLASRLDGVWKEESKFHALVCDLRASHNLLLAKPTTMMNLSGQSAQALVQYYKMDLEDVWVIYDELDLLFGQLRVRKGGGTAGHNGIKSLVQHLGEDFWRIRLGIQNDLLAATPSDQFVLDNFNSTEKPHLAELVQSAADYIEAALKTGTLDDHSHYLLKKA